jgi:hypothetical protein
MYRLNDKAVLFAVMPDCNYGRGATVGIDEVMERAKDLVEVRRVLRQSVNVKGD